MGGDSRSIGTTSFSQPRDAGRRGHSLVIALVTSARIDRPGTMAGVAMYRYKTRFLPFWVLTPIAIPEILMGVSLLIFSSS
jgi:ABC-type spermidine/putrescine transport system permease subunit II